LVNGVKILQKSENKLIIEDKLTIENRLLKKIFATYFGKFLEIPMLILIRFIEKIFLKNFRYYFYRKTQKYWGGKVIPVKQSISSEVEVRPSQEIFELVKRAEVVAITDCFCRTNIYHDKNCKAPVHTCIILARGQYLHEIDKMGFNMKVPKEKVFKILELSEKWGLVHQLIHFPNKDFFYVICNCCPCCCAVLSTYRIFGEQTYLIKPSDFIVKYEADLCNNCGLCLNYCHFGAIKKDGSSKIITNLELCKGCGLCVSHCPQNARILIPRK
ncbi:MAG: ATP-binding protein, partial [Candidatus Helarchaeota archaeon]